MLPSHRVGPALHVRVIVASWEVTGLDYLSLPHGTSRERHRRRTEVKGCVNRRRELEEQESLASGFDVAGSSRTGARTAATLPTLTSHRWELHVGQPNASDPKRGLHELRTRMLRLMVVRSSRERQSPGPRAVRGPCASLRASALSRHIHDDKHRYRQRCRRSQGLTSSSLTTEYGLEHT